MSQQDDGSFRKLCNEDDVLSARAMGEPIFREGDHVVVKNCSIPDQPDGRFVITLIKKDDMVLLGLPK